MMFLKSNKIDKKLIKRYRRINYPTPPIRYTKKLRSFSIKQFLRDIKRNWIVFRQAQILKQKKAKAGLSIFNFEAPCPDNIINCHELRELYRTRVQLLQKTGACTTCNVSVIKAAIIDQIIFQNVD